MNTTLHPEPEEIMAYLDGELAPAETHDVKTHLATCPPCSAVLAQFQQTAQMLAAWEVPALPEARERCISKAIENTVVPSKQSEKQTHRWMVFGLGTVGLAVALVLASPVLNRFVRNGHMSKFSAKQQMSARFEPADKVGSPSPVVAPEAIDTNGLVGGLRSVENRILPAPPPPPPSPIVSSTPIFVPLIARNVTLTLRVANVPATRSRIDAILTQYQGYAARLSVANDSDAHSISASLQVPASQLAAALTELKALGNVQSEEQTGEDVSQQHIDLDARLRNARETEDRLRGILADRAGKMSDVLEVEEEISTVRGQIEQMEAEQQALDHRVAFSTIDLTVVELDRQTATTPGARLLQSIQTGWHDAAAMLLGIVLFFAEDGPSILIWLAILSVPGFFLWRRYKRLRAQE